VSVPHLILASASPRRRELLDCLGANYLCQPAHIDETPVDGESPQDYVARMALEKATAIAEHYPAPAYAVLAADTTVVLDHGILGKPRDRGDAMGMLARLSGRAHTVITAICLSGPGGLLEEQVETEVEFQSLDQRTCEAYLATDEPWDKAGGYGIQGLGGALVRAIRGSYSNVVGLPLPETRQLLAGCGIPTLLDPVRPGSGGLA
jgi:septum formation protein